MIYELIKLKLVDYAEIVVVLFENCNLRCAMCSQDHETLEHIDEDSIMSKVDYIVNWINNKESEYFKLHIMGGELFQDHLIDAGYIQIYQNFIDSISERTDKNINFNFITNLVFDNVDPVLQFLERNNLNISISYDSKNRFSPKDFELFKNNVEIFKDKISMVSCVMHVLNMRAVTAGDEYFDYLYDNFLIDWDSYWPSQSHKTNQMYMPKESEAYEFYKILINRYPKCINIEHFVTDNPVMAMTCTRGNNTTILQDNTVPEGCSGTAFVSEIKTKDLVSDDIVTNFFEKYNCFNCKYFQKCPFTCFVKADYKYIEDDLDDCLYRKLFDYTNNIICKG